MITNVGYLFAKGLKKVMEDAWADEPDRLEAVIPNETSDMAFVEWTSFVGPELAVEKPKGQEFVEKEMIVKDPKRIWHVAYGLQVRVPFEDVDDDQYQKLTPLTDKVGRSIRIRMAVERAMMLNGAFSTFNLTCYDGLSIINSAHTLDKPTYTYGSTNITAGSQTEKNKYTWSNQLATPQDLDYLALVDAVTLLRRTPNWEGDPMDIEPKYVIAGVPNWQVLDEVIGSSTRPDTANRADSAVQPLRLTGIETARLLDDDAWFVLSDKHDLRFYLRQAIKTKVNVDPLTWDYLTQGLVRFVTGVFDPRGVVGTPGA